MADPRKEKKVRFKELFDILADWSKNWHLNGPEIEWAGSCMDDDPEISCIQNWRGLVQSILDRSHSYFKYYEFSKELDTWLLACGMNIFVVENIGFVLLENDIFCSEEVKKVIGFLLSYDDILDFIAQKGSRGEELENIIRYRYHYIQRILYDLESSLSSMVVAICEKMPALSAVAGQNRRAESVYIELNRAARTLIVGDKSERIIGKAWDILLYLEELRKRGDGARRTIDIDGKRADIKNAKDWLRRKFSEYAERIIENRGGLYYLGAGVKVIHGGQIGIRPNKQRQISRNDIER